MGRENGGRGAHRCVSSDILALGLGGAFTGVHYITK